MSTSSKLITYALKHNGTIPTVIPAHRQLDYIQGLHDPDEVKRRMMNYERVMFIRNPYARYFIATIRGLYATGAPLLPPPLQLKLNECSSMELHSKHEKKYLVVHVSQWLAFVLSPHFAWCYCLVNGHPLSIHSLFVFVVSRIVPK